MKYISFILFFYTITVFSAAYKPVTGIVLDVETKEPLPFTNIVIKGQGRGTVANIEGVFVLDLKGTNPTDTVEFRYVGYKTLKIRIADLENTNTIYLKPAIINLKEIEVSSKDLTIDKILGLVKKNFNKNYPVVSQKQNLFFHKYEKTPFPEENKMNLKKSNFETLDKEKFDTFFSKIPKEFSEYYDAIIDLYSHEENHKLIPQEAISLEESSMSELAEELENLVGDFFADIEKSKENKEEYFKIKSGILSYKIGHKKKPDSSENDYKDDSVTYHVSTKYLKGDILSLYKNYTRLKSKNWEFLNKQAKYKYKKDLAVLNDELVYEISFTPKKSGLLEGVMYISMEDYAILQLDFNYAEGKQSGKFQLLGFGYAMNYKKGRVIFERAKEGYFVKYIYAQQQEYGSVERDLVVMKKKKRFLLDKELNEIKIEIDLSFTTDAYWEVLVLDREMINTQQYEQVEQPKVIEFRREVSYSPDMWDDKTVITPASELKKYTRK